MIPNFQFSLSPALRVITRADLWPALEEDSISLVSSRLPGGDEDFSGAHEDESWKVALDLPATSSKILLVPVCSSAQDKFYGEQREISGSEHETLNNAVESRASLVHVEQELQ